MFLSFAHASSDASRAFDLASPLQCALEVWQPPQQSEAYPARETYARGEHISLMQPPQIVKKSLPETLH